MFNPGRASEVADGTLQGWALFALDRGRITGYATLGAGMLVVFAVGIVKVSVATWALFESATGIAHQPSMTAATDFLKGLEYLFLAPLGLLTFRALVRYVIVQIEVAATPADRPPQEADLIHEQANRNLLRLKEFISGLITAIVATDLVSKVVLETNPARLKDIDGELAVLVASVTYVWVLSRESGPQ